MKRNILKLSFFIVILFSYNIFGADIDDKLKDLRSRFRPPVYADINDNLKEFHPELLTEVSFSSDPYGIKDSYIVYDNVKYTNENDKNKEWEILFKFDKSCINFAKKSSNVLRFLPNGSYVTIELKHRDKQGIRTVWKYICSKRGGEDTRIYRDYGEMKPVESLKAFDPTLLTEVSFSNDPYGIKDSYIVYDNVKYTNKHDVNNGTLNIYFKFDNNCKGFAKTSPSVLAFLPDEGYVWIELVDEVLGGVIWRYICSSKKIEIGNDIFREVAYKKYSEVIHEFINFAFDVDNDNLKDFNPELLTEVSFSSDPYGIKDSYIVYDNVKYSNKYDKNKIWSITFQFSDKCKNFSKKAPNVLKYLPDEGEVLIELRHEWGGWNGIWQYICNNKENKRQYMFVESLYDDGC